MLLIIDDNIPFIRGHAERLGECIYKPGAEITADDVRHADVLIVRTRTRVDRRLLDGSSVQLVVTATIGHDHIDKDYLESKGLVWKNCPGCNAQSVAQYVRNSMLLASAKGLIDTRFSSGTLPFDRPLTVGIVGMGNVGTAVAETLQAEGCRILRCDPPKGEPATLADVAREADVITFHTPLTTDTSHPTHHLADADFFGSLRRRPLFINAARGECADTAALKAALRKGLISGAVIDTWENEPCIDEELLDRAFIATPHIAGYSADGKANGTRMSLQAVARHFSLAVDFDIRPPMLPADFSYGNAHRERTAALSPAAKEQLRLYDPSEDTRALKADVSLFEQLRGHYPLRREQ